MTDVVTNIETKVETEAKAVENTAAIDAKKVETVVVDTVNKTETVVKVEAKEIVLSAEEKAEKLAERIKLLIQTHLNASKVAQAAIDEANKLITDAKSEAKKVSADAEKAKKDAELFISATEGVFKHIITKIRSWF